MEDIGKIDLPGVQAMVRAERDNVGSLVVVLSFFDESGQWNGCVHHISFLPSFLNHLLNQNEFFVDVPNNTGSWHANSVYLPHLLASPYFEDTGRFVDDHILIPSRKLAIWRLKPPYAIPMLNKDETVKTVIDDIDGEKVEKAYQTSQFLKWEITEIHNSSNVLLSEIALRYLNQIGELSNQLKRIRDYFKKP